jgi:uncharacterized SAM-binding protein YcdF (DUF218 family)
MMNTKLSSQDWQDFSAIYKYMNTRDQLPSRADAIIAGGAGSRIDMAECAAELYRLGLAPIIVVSGYRHPDFTEDEAELLGRVLLQNDVPESAILREPNATNTGQNVTLSAADLRSAGIIPQSVILVHRPFMTRRFKATAQAQWPTPQPHFFVTSAEYTIEEYYERDRALGLGQRMLYSMLGDYERITTYAEIGWQTPEPPSPTAEAAYQRLIAHGFKAR